jgi:hypothetical protein
MDIKEISVQKILLVLFVLIISMFVGWYGEKAVEKFFSNLSADEVQNI